jgi:hypothetical protein
MQNQSLTSRIEEGLLGSQPALYFETGTLKSEFPIGRFYHGYGRLARRQV